jgi:predicted HicB family RNase H-like nuclease
MALSRKEKSRRVQIQISPALHHRLARAAQDSGISKSAIVRVALEREFAHQEQLEREIAHHQSLTLTES